MTSSGAALRAGLCSVTLRAQPVPEVARLAAAAGLRGIEWGGDIHVPPGDEAAAALARRVSEDAGLAVVSYGSYLACATGSADGTEAVLDTTEALGAPAVRVWGPGGVEPGARAAERGAVADAAATVADAAHARGLDVYLEFHGGTITASAASAVALLDAVGALNLFCAWQPPYWAPQPLGDDLDDLRRLGPRLAHLHVYDWEPDGRRHALVDGEAAWPARLAVAADAGARSTFASGSTGRAALLEFVRDDDPAALAADAAALLGWLARPSSSPAP
jgi:sugar phosphate isomerase/epimerase